MPLCLQTPVEARLADRDRNVTPMRRSRMVLNRMADCPVCLVPHDEEIHLATLGLHQWFRGEVTKSFLLP